MTLLMWIGRLEVLPVLVLLTRGYWQERVASRRLSSALGVRRGPSARRRAHLAELAGLPDHDERVAVEDHVVGLRAGDRLRLAQDRDHGHARPLAEARNRRACAR